METTIEILRKNTLGNAVNKRPETGCCGGEALSNEDACCKLDEDKKAEGELGCGCNSNKIKIHGSGCC